MRSPRTQRRRPRAAARITALALAALALATFAPAPVAASVTVAPPTVETKSATPPPTPKPDPRFYDFGAKLSDGAPLDPSETMTCGCAPYRSQRDNVVLNRRPLPPVTWSDRAARVFR